MVGVLLKVYTIFRRLAEKLGYSGYDLLTNHELNEAMLRPYHVCEGRENVGS